MIVKPPLFCHRCGGTLDYSGDRSGSDRSPAVHPVCTKCGRTDHLDPKLCACALVVDRRKILLARRAADRPEAGRWNLPGGFVDRGETVEAAAAREVFEETGLEVEIGRLVGVFSYPGDPVVVVVYEAEPVSGRLAPGDESDDAAWFLPDDIPWDALAFRSSKGALKKFFAIG